MESMTLVWSVLVALSISFIIDITSRKVGVLVYLLFFGASLFYESLLLFYPIVIQPLPIVFLGDKHQKLDDDHGFVFGKSKRVLYSVSFLSLPLIVSFLFREVDWLIFFVAVMAYRSTFFEVELSVQKRLIYQTDDAYKLKLKEKQREERELLNSKAKDIEIAILNERNRIAREIHDSVGHTISGAIIQTEAMRASSTEALPAQIDALQANLKNGMAEIRSSLHAIHDTSIDLAVSIKSIIESNPSVDFVFNYKVSSEFSYPFKREVLMIVKEAVANSMKHAKAKHISIDIIEMPKHFRILIADDGVGGFRNDVNVSDEMKQRQEAQNPKIVEGIGFTSFKEFAKKYNGRFVHEGGNTDTGERFKIMFLLDKAMVIGNGFNEV